MPVQDLLDVTKDPVYQELLSEYPKAAPEAVECALQFMRVAAFVNLRQEQKLGEFGLTIGRFHLLMLLRHEPSRALSPSELAKRTRVSRGTMTQFIDALEKDALVRRADDENDRRAMLIQLTSKGDALLKKILPAHLEKLSRITQVLNRSERKTLIDLMEKVRDGLVASEAELD
jgi:DNA-binding MarR family transcriptional regulator